MKPLDVYTGKESHRLSNRRPRRLKPDAPSASLATLATLFITLSSAAAADRAWNVATGDFADGANWNPTFVAPWPAVDRAIISNSGTSTLSTGSVTMTETWVGQNANGTAIGTLEQTGGSFTLSDGLVIGRQGSASGTANITGGTLTTRHFRMGGGSATSQGTMTVSGSGTVFATGVGAALAVVGIGSPGVATFTLDQSAVWNAGVSNVFVGGDNNVAGTTSTALGGTGTLNIRNGAAMNMTGINLAIGRNGNGNGTITVSDGGTLTITNSGGSDSLFNLANVNLASTIPMGASNPVATVNLSGATSSITVPRVLTGLGTVTMNLNGGTLTAGRFNKNAGPATIHFNGTTIRATVDHGDYFGGFTTAGLDIQAGGLIFDTNTRLVVIAQAMSGTGGLTKVGEGSLLLSGQNLYTGDTIVTTGSIQLVPVNETNVNILNDAAALRLAAGTTLITSAATETVNAFYIAGVQQAAGTWGPVDSGAQHESEQITGDGFLLVTTGGGTPPASPFVNWATATKGLSGNDALPTADPDNDGYSNLAEFVLGGEPNPATPGAGTNALAPAVTTGTGNHVFSFRRTQLSTTQTGLTVGYEYGSALTGWTPAVNGENSITIVPTENGYGSGIDRIDVTIPDGLAVGSKIFARMKAVLTPP